MSDADEPRLISCDESGSNGPNLLDADQPLFAYAAHDLTVAESEALVADIRARRRPPIANVELKASQLRKRAYWPEIAGEVLEATRGRYLVITADKRLVLAANAFEYLIEPVISEKSAFFYSLGLPRLVAAAVHNTIRVKDGPAEAVAREMKDFMKGFDPAKAPTVFGGGAGLPGEAAVLNDVLRFARGYRDKIERRSRHLQDPDGIGRWVLDPVSTCFYSLLVCSIDHVESFGHRHRRVKVLCDESEPLLAMKSYFDEFIGRDDAFPIEGGVRRGVGRLNLSESIVFDDSAKHASLQVADLLAGITADAFKPNGRLADLCREILPHVHTNWVMPEDEPIDWGEPSVAFNRELIAEFAQRADAGVGPFEGMEDVLLRLFRRYGPPAGSPFAAQ